MGKPANTQEEPVSVTPLVNLELLMEMDEPYLFIQDLEKAACRARLKSERWAEWDLVVAHVRKCLIAIEQLNRATAEAEAEG